MNEQKHDIITETEILQGVPEPIRSFIAVDTLPLPRSFESIIKAFWLATEKITSVIRIRKRIHIVFAKAPFVLKCTNGEFKYTPYTEQTINVHLEDSILLDCEKMLRYPFPIQTACILEELVHVAMSVADETLVSQIVALLYDGIRLVDSKYAVAAQPKT